MDSRRFDSLSRELSRARSRRGALAALLGGTLGLLGLTETTAKRKKHKKKHPSPSSPPGSPPSPPSPAPPTCTDAIKNGSETGVDCGGPQCPRCANGQGCLGRDDCAGALCSSGVCQICELGASECGEDAFGTCDCSRVGTGGPPFCSSADPASPFVADCGDCPAGTLCFQPIPNSAPRQCRKRCGEA